MRANAVRLADSGAPKQKADAAELLPAIEAELAERLAKKPPKARRGKKDVLH